MTQPKVVGTNEQNVAHRCSKRARWLLLVVVGLSFGCVSDQWAQLRKIPRNPLTNQLGLDSRRGPEPTPRTKQMLRRNDLADLLDGDPETLLLEVQAVAAAEPTAENVYAVAELAYIAAKQFEADDNEDVALDLYGTAVANAYFYLFDEAFDNGRNPYDPRFRRACDLYNSALEGGLRTINERGLLHTGATHTIETVRQTFDINVAIRGTWHEENFGELKFVSDFEVNELTNRYHNFGLGVPMIATYEPRADQPRPAEEFYPPGMSFPVTAFLRVNKITAAKGDEKPRHRCVIELHDPMKSSDIVVNNRLVPLETDLTTPLAYSLDNPVFKRVNGATRGLWRPQDTSGARGLYMLEPYDANKIPVVMIHGFWSSLVTWMEMFNDLRGLPEIRDHYQFWFYLYPTGEPFWFTATQLRADLARMRDKLDQPLYATPLDQMVLIGHSMGGLVAELQTMQSGSEFWDLVSDRPLNELAAVDNRDELAQTFYFEPNPSVRRVVSIATPHRGSSFSNRAIQWLGRKLINVPQNVESSRSQALIDDPEFFPEESILRISNSVGSMSVNSPILPLMLSSPRPPWVKYHNIIGLLDDVRVIGRVVEGTDGVVAYDSAHLDNVDSEITVSADHTSVHRSPRAILEVRRILLEHIAQLNRTGSSFPSVPLTDNQLLRNGKLAIRTVSAH